MEKVTKTAFGRLLGLDLRASRQNTRNPRRRYCMPLGIKLELNVVQARRGGGGELCGGCVGSINMTSSSVVRPG